MNSKERTVGLVLAGAVAKGAYHAGVLSVLAERDVRLRRIAASSAGALCAAVLAAGVATGRVQLAVRVIEESWRYVARWRDVVQFSPSAILRGQGFSSSAKVRAQVAKAIDRVLFPATLPSETQEPYPAIEFRLIGTDLGGMGGRYGAGATHERWFQFRGMDFETAAGRERIALATAASSALPGLFAPVQVGRRFVLDGGAVDNAPLSYILGAEEVQEAIVVTASASNPTVLTRAPGGVALAGDVLEIMVDERLTRDLRAADRANARRVAIDQAIEKQSLTETQRKAILAALDLREIRVTEIRPLVDLPGTPFSALGDASLRAEYIRIGKERARAVFQESASP